MCLQDKSSHKRRKRSDNDWMGQREGVPLLSHHSYRRICLFEIVFSTLAEMCTIEMGDPLHSLIIPGQLHPMELDMLKMFAVAGK